MKNQFLFSFILLLSLGIFGQNIRGGLIVGGNLSQVDGDEVYGFYKSGWNVGATAIIPFENGWSIAIETLLSQKGAFKKYPISYDTVLTVDMLPYYNLRLNYLEIPVSVHYNDKDVVTAGAGFSYNRLTSGKEIEYGREIQWEDKRGPYDRGDFNVFADVRFRAWWKIWINFRYSYSLSYIRIRTYTTDFKTWDRKQYNNFLSFRMIYMINDKVPPKKKKK
jgi:hypothetical protein